jgi:hypothetical protein
LRTAAKSHTQLRCREALGVEHWLVADALLDQPTPEIRNAYTPPQPHAPGRRSRRLHFDVHRSHIPDRLELAKLRIRPGGGGAGLPAPPPERSVWRLPSDQPLIELTSL